MIRASTVRSCAAMAAALLLVPLAARADYFSATISVKSLSPTLQVCRDSGAAINGFDEEWQILIDVDNNPATGMQDSGGVDAAILIYTPDITLGCAAHTVNTQDTISATLYQPDAAGDAFEATAIPVALSFDFNHSTMTATALIAGPLSGLSLGSVVAVGAGGSYLAYSNNQSAIAIDGAAQFPFQSSTADATNDVQGCTAPCTPDADWYGLIDITAVSTTRLAWIFRNGFEQ